MMTYVASLAVGILVGIIYCLMGVRSPAPPIIALLGLLGILIGEHGFPLVKEKIFHSNTKDIVTKVEKAK